jgi:hypothetical protein
MTTELEEVLQDVNARISSMTTSQMDRYFRQPAATRGTIEQFITLPREEELSRRCMQLIDAKIAIEHILGR